MMTTRPNGNGGALAGCTIVEIGLQESGQHATMLLARMGARVVKLEPLAGESGRLAAPFADDVLGDRRSVPYEFLNAGKSSVAVDLQDPFAYRLLAQLTGDWGAVVVSPEFAPFVPAGLEVPVVAAGPFGATGLNVDFPSTPFTRFQVGGSGYLVATPRPSMPGTLVGESMAGAGIAVCVLGLLLMHLRAGNRKGSPLRADYSAQAHAANLEKLFVGRASKEEIEPDREGHRYPFGGAVACRDGFVSMLIFEEHQWHGLCRAIGREEWASHPDFRGWAGRASQKEDIAAALQAWCCDKTVEEILSLTRPHGVAIGSAKTPAQVLDDEWMHARGFISERETAFGPAKVPRLPYGSHPLWDVPMRESAPLPGEHSAAVMQQLGFGAEPSALLESLQLVRYSNAAN